MRDIAAKLLCNPLLNGIIPARLSILIYHSVHETADIMRPFDPTKNEFTWQMEILSRHFNPMSLENALELLSEGKLPQKTVCVTFDDGYADNESIALPILKKFDIPATVFVSTAYMNGGCMWNDLVIESLRSYRESWIDLTDIGLGQRRLDSASDKVKLAGEIIYKLKHQSPLKRNSVAANLQERAGLTQPDLMLTDNQLLNLVANGVEIGGHTHSHPILSVINEGEARLEIERNKVELEKITKHEVRFFAYPNGNPGVDFTARDKQIVKDAGYKAAVSTRVGVSGKVTDVWELPRFTPWDKKPQMFHARLQSELFKSIFGYS